MEYTPYYIASFDGDSGLNTYFEPFLIPEKAFPVLQDAYCWRGKVLKREGFELLGRLRRILTLASINNISSAGAGVVVVNIFNELGISGTEPFAQLMPGNASVAITIVIGGAIGQTLTDSTSTGTMTISAVGVITAATINYHTGDLTLTFSGAAAASPATFSGSYYPGLPVMGLRTQEKLAINQEDTIAFDQKYAYKFNRVTGLFEELPSTLPVVWHGTDSNFFWSTNYFSSGTNELFWVTNTNMTGTRDPIYYYDTVTWTPFSPMIDGGNTLYNAEIILPYKNRLIFLNTWEGPAGAGIGSATNFPQTIRWSQNGTPLTGTAFLTEAVGYGGFLNAPTNEVIIGAEFIKDTLLVKFERSSWKLVYTGNEVLPFVLQKINTELGSESKFSLIPFDRGVFSVGSYGITTDDSVNVERIDVQIPDTIFQFNNDNSGVVRVQGIRDFTNELVYWTYPNAPQNPEFPNRVLVLNYRNNTYAIFTDSFTCYGYFQRTIDLTWSDLNYFAWAGWNTRWNSGATQSFYPNVIAGNQLGYVEIIGQKPLNDPSLFIASIDFSLNPVQFTVPYHNLESGDIVKITDIIGAGLVNPNDLNGLTYQVTVIDANTITLDVFTGVSFNDLISADLVSAGSIYIGDGQLTKINNFIIKTKRFTPFYEEGSQCRLGYVDFYLFKTTNGELTSDIFIDDDDTFSLTDSDINTSLLGSSTINSNPDNLDLIPFQANQKKIWHRQFIQAIAQNFQVSLSFSPVQNANLAIVEEQFELHAMAFYLSKNSRLTQ